MMNDSLYRMVARDKAMSKMLAASVAAMDPMREFNKALIASEYSINAINDWVLPKSLVSPIDEFYKNISCWKSAFGIPTVDALSHLNDINQAIKSFDIPKVDFVNNHGLEGFHKAHGLINKQLKTISELEKFESANIDEYGLNDVLETVDIEELEKQYETIKEEKESPIKTYLKENHLMILSILIPILLFVWTFCLNKETSEQNEKIISLLEQQNQIAVETLSEEQQQTKLIEIQNQLLKELITDINTKLDKQDKE